MNAKSWIWMAAAAVMACVLVAETGHAYSSSYSGSYYGRSYSRYGYRRRNIGWGWSAVSQGPRMGAVAIGGELGDQMKAAGMSTVQTLWGWQFELQYGNRDNKESPTGLVEVVPLISGFDREEPVANLNVLVGVRAPSGLEFCAGPYMSMTGSGFTMALGYTFTFGDMNVPANIAMTETAEGRRVSLTFGWNLPR
jgi:hypothetical protein